MTASRPAPGPFFSPCFTFSIGGCFPAGMTFQAVVRTHFFPMGCPAGETPFPCTALSGPGDHPALLWLWPLAAVSPPRAETKPGILLDWWGGPARCEAASSPCPARAPPDLLSAHTPSGEAWLLRPAPTAGGQEPPSWASPEGPLDALAGGPIGRQVGGMGLPFPP